MPSGTLSRAVTRSTYFYTDHSETGWWWGEEASEEARAAIRAGSVRGLDPVVVR